MTHEVTMIMYISFIIFASPLISRALKLPIIPVEILLGSVGALIGFIHHSEIFELVAEVGFLYLMFLAGLEVDLRKLLNIPMDILKKSTLYLLTLYFLSTLITLYFDAGLIFIAIMPLISIGLLAALKKEYGDTDWIKLGIVVGLIGEIVSIIVLTAVSAGLQFGFGLKLYSTLALFTAFLIFMGVAYKLFHNFLWWYPELKNYLMPKEDTQEQDIRLSMAIFFVMIAVMIYFELEVAFGAFLAGTFIATFFEHKEELPEKLEHFGFGWLVPIFFISVGAAFNLTSLFEDGLFLSALYITIAMIVIRIVASLFFIKDLGIQKFAMLGLSHSMPLTLLIAIATLAFHNNTISEFYYFVFILASILEVLIVMMIIKLICFYISRKNKKTNKEITN